MAFNMNPMQMMQFIRGGGNPQQLAMNMLEGQAQNNPIAANLLNLAKNNKGDDIEQIARNLMKEQGKDFDKEFAGFRKTFGL